MLISAELRRNAESLPAGAAWLAELPAIRARLARRWGLAVGQPFTAGVAAWTAPALTGAGTDVVLKISLPHPEARDEAAALRYWDGAGAARLLDDAPEDWGLLLERCLPGTSLADDDAPRAERLAVAARVLAALTARIVPEPCPGPAAGAEGTAAPPAVATMRAECDRGALALEETAARWRSAARRSTGAVDVDVDPGVVAQAAALLRELPRTADRAVVVHGDLNPGNLLRSARTWLAIDPKPLLGDPAFDPWPLLSQVDDPFARPDPVGALRARTAVVATEAGLDADRVVAWGLARSVQSAFWDVGRGRRAGARAELDRARVWAALVG